MTTYQNKDDYVPRFKVGDRVIAWEGTRDERHATIEPRGSLDGPRRLARDHLSTSRDGG